MSGLICIRRSINQVYFGESFRQVPTFGRDTIRRFHKNVSGLKRLAARDFEDILQVSISFSILLLLSVLLNMIGA